MKHFLTTLLIMLAIPLVAIAVAQGGQLKYGADLHKALAEAYPDVSREKIGAVTIAAYLASVDSPELDWLRRDAGLFRAMTAVGIAVICLCLSFLAWTALAGRLAQGRRSALLALFRPSYYVASLILVGVTLANGLLLVGSFYFGETLLIHSYHPKLLFLVGAGALFGCAAIVKAVLSTFKRETGTLEGELASPGSGIRRLIDDLTGKMGLPRVDNIVVGKAPSFFATQAKLALGETVLEGRTIYLSRPLCAWLSPEELASIAAHELGHFKGEDTAYTLSFYPIYRGLAGALQNLYSSSGGIMALALLPTRAVFGRLYDSFASAERKLGRERELAADAVAVEMSGGAVFASALVKTSLLLDLLGRVADTRDRESEDDEESSEEDILLRRFAEAPKEFGSEDYERVLGGTMVHPFDTHPSLKERLAAASIDMADLVQALDFSPEPPAAASLDS